jgi:antitoxin (DNA-binding transcriptional repressor) of toxin-antitoxin stability system
MKTITISTKEIRNDLEGFLRKIKNGQTIQVMYRSRPLVTLAAQEEHDALLNSRAGSHIAAVNSVAFAKRLSSRKPNFDAHKSFKELYDETQTI